MIQEIQSTKRYVNLIETFRVEARDFDDITFIFSRIYMTSVTQGYPERQAQLVVEDIPTLPTEPWRRIDQIVYIEGDTPQFTCFIWRLHSLGSYRRPYPFHSTPSTVNGPHKGGHCGIGQQPGWCSRNRLRSADFTRIWIWIASLIF